MHTMIKSGLWPVLATCALFLAASSQAMAAPVVIKYTGSGYDTTVDNLGDGMPVTLSLTQAKGSFGAKRAEITAEFMPGEADCEEGYDSEVELFYSASVFTFGNNDQLFGISNEGWMCVHTGTGHYYGEVYGAFIGGTGRFEGATGEFMSDFTGYSLEPPILETSGFRSISGSVRGKINWAAKD